MLHMLSLGDTYERKTLRLIYERKTTHTKTKGDTITCVLAATNSK